MRRAALVLLLTVCVLGTERYAMAQVFGSQDGRQFWEPDDDGVLGESPFCGPNSGFGGALGGTGALGAFRWTSAFMTPGVGYIECQVYDNGSGEQVTCDCEGLDADDGGDNQSSCTSSSSAFVTAAKALHADSYISFASDVNGNCSDLFVVNSSELSPISPAGY